MVELRARAGTLFAAAAIATSFFGAQTLARHDLDAAGCVAVGCFVLLSFAVLVLWPRQDWEFSLAPKDCRVAGGIAASGPHRSAREPLDSYGSCRSGLSG